MVAPVVPLSPTKTTVVFERSTAFRSRPSSVSRDSIMASKYGRGLAAGAGVAGGQVVVAVELGRRLVQWGMAGIEGHPSQPWLAALRTNPSHCVVHDIGRGVSGMIRLGDSVHHLRPVVVIRQRPGDRTREVRPTADLVRRRGIPAEMPLPEAGLPVRGRTRRRQHPGKGHLRGLQHRVARAGDRVPDSVPERIPPRDHGGARWGTGRVRIAATEKHPLGPEGIQVRSRRLVRRRIRIEHRQAVRSHVVRDDEQDVARGLGGSGESRRGEEEQRAGDDR